MRVLVVDKRKRVTLGALAKHGIYLARVQDDGVIVLTPAAVISEGAWARTLADAQKYQEAERAKFDEPPF